MDNPLQNGSCIKKRISPTRQSTYYAIEGSPLLELLSLSLSKHGLMEAGDKSEALCVEIFGHILLIDEYGNEFTLFKRKSVEAKSVYLDGTSDSSVILQSSDFDSPRCLPSKFYVDFYLRDKHRSIVIVDDCKFFDCTNVVAYDKVQQFDFYNTIHVNYVIFHCALVACVSVVVENNREDNNAICAQVSGTIIASNAMSDLSYIDRIIFDKSEELTYGAVNISSTFAVPSHSVLEIHSNIKVNDDNVAASLKFEPYGKPGLAFQDRIFGEKSCIRVFVEFAPAKSVLLEYPITEWKGLETIERAFDENIIDFFEDRNVNFMIEMPTFTRPTSKFLKKDRLIYIQPHLEHLREMQWNTYSVSYDRDALMEIFSVSVHPICGDCDSLRLKGIIKATDGSRNTVLFDGDKLPVDLFPNENVRLKGPRSCYRGEYFGIYCDLKDNEGREISSGYATYDLSKVSSWYNRRICSVVKGEHGFATLHYTIFSDAVQAKLKFSLECLDSTDVRVEVGGWAVCRYGNFGYSSHYARKYYQSILFGEPGSVKLIKGQIPLLKSVVAVPLNSTLIVLANIRVFCGGICCEVLSYSNSFNPIKPQRPEIRNDVVYGSNFRLLVSVEWTGILCL